MRSEILFIREPDRKLPDEFKIKVLEQFPTALGFASPQDDEQIHSDIFVGDEHDLKDAIEQIEENYAKSRVFYYAVKADEGEISFNSLQPIELISDGEGEDKKTLLMSIAEGEFAKHADDEKPDFTNGYRLIQGFLTTKLTELLEFANGDIDRLMALLEKPALRKEMQDHLAPRGTVLLIPFKGKAVAYSDNKDQGTWGWGFATKTLGIPLASTPAEKPKLTLRAKAAAPPDEKVVVTPQENYAPLLKDSRFYLLNSVVMVRPPQGQGIDFKNAKTFWNTHSVLDRPDDPKEIYKGFPMDKLRANSNLRDVIEKLMGIKPKVAESEQGPETAPKKEVKTEPEVEKNPYLIPADMKAAYLNIKKADKLPDMTREELKKSLSDYPLSYEQLGEEADNLLMKDIKFFNRLPGPVKTRLMHDWRCAILGISQEKEEKVEIKPKLTLRQKSQAA